MQQKQIRLILLILIIILGFSLRLYHLDKESIWFDESATASIVTKSDLSSVISETSKVEIKPPLDYILLHYWSRLFGSSVFTLRFYYLIFGVLSIPLLYLLGTKLFNHKVGLLSSLLLSISQVNVMYSQEMRSYSLLAFLTIASYLFYVRLFKENLSKKSDSKKNYIYLTIINSITNAVHYFGIITMIIQGVIFFTFYTKKKIEIKKWILTQIIPLIIFLIFMKFSLPKLLKFHYDLQKVLPSSISQLGVYSFVLLIVVAIIALFLLFIYLKKLVYFYEKMNKSIIIPIIVLVWLIIMIIAVDALITPFFLTRYSLFIIPFWYIFISKGISDIKIKKLQSIILIIIILFSSFSLFTYYSKTTKEQCKDVADYIRNNEKPNEIIFFDYRSMRRPFDYYYDGSLEEQGLSEKKDSDIKELVGSKSGVWLILSHNWKTKHFYKNQLDSYYNLTFEETEEYKGIELYYYSTDIVEDE